MKNIFALGILVFGMCFPVKAQTTATFKQMTPGSPCHVTGCINGTLEDGEFFSWSDTLQHYGNQNIYGHFSFRGLNYFMCGQASGYELIDLSNCGGQPATINEGQFSIHEAFAVHCFRSCSDAWLNGTVTVANEYFGVDPVNYGSVTSGTGQVGVAKASSSDVTATLTSSNTKLIQVPSAVTITAGTLDSDFTVTATPPTENLIPSYVTITATFADGTTSSMSVIVNSIPPPPPPPDGND